MPWGATQHTAPGCVASAHAAASLLHAHNTVCCLLPCHLITLPSQLLLQQPQQPRPPSKPSARSSRQQLQRPPPAASGSSVRTQPWTASHLRQPLLSPRASPSAPVPLGLGASHHRAARVQGQAIRAVQPRWTSNSTSCRWGLPSRCPFWVFTGWMLMQWLWCVTRGTAACCWCLD